MFEKDMILQGTTPSLTITINPEDVQLSDIVDAVHGKFRLMIKEYL